MAETIANQNGTKEMSVSDYAQELESQKKQISSQKFPARTLKFQAETISKLAPSERGRITQKKETFVGQRTKALGGITKEERRVAGEIESQLEATGSLTNYTSAYQSQPQEFKQYIKSPTQKRGELDKEVSKINQEIADAQKSLERYTQKRAEAETTAREHDAEEEMKYYRELIKKFGEGKSRIQQGQFLTKDEVYRYAKDYARAEKRELEAINKARESGLTEIREKGVSKGWADLSKIGEFGSKVTVKQLEQKGIDVVKQRGKVTGFEFTSPTQTQAVVEPTIKTETFEPTIVDGITSQAKVSTDKTFFQKLGDAFNTTGIGMASAKDLNMSGSLGGYDTQRMVSDRDGRGFLGKIWSSITGAATGVMGDKEIDRAKGQDIFKPEFGTVSASPLVSEDLPELKTEPYYETRVVDTFKPTGSKDIVPLTQTFYVDPTVTGTQFERALKTGEQEYFKGFTTALRTPEESAELGLAPTTGYERKGFEKLSYEARQIKPKAEAFLGIDLTSESKAFKATETFLAEPWEKGVGGKTGSLIGGGIRGFVPTTPTGILTTATTFGVGAGVGAGIKGSAALASKVPKIGGILSSGIKGSAYLGGAYMTGAYGVGVATAVSATEDYGAKGQLIGSAGRDFLALGAGFKAGGKGVDMFRGWRATRGRTEIPIEDLVPESVLSGKQNFPTAPKGTHYKLFQETPIKYPELTGGKSIIGTLQSGSELFKRKGNWINLAERNPTGQFVKFADLPKEGKPGGFHTTGDRFWKGSIEPQAGTSELPGLYVGSDVSIHFARLGAAGKSGGNILPKISEMFAPEGKPGIAFLQPKRFRINPFTGQARKPIIESGVRKDFAGFRKPVEPGAADIPKMKTEIEAVLRPGSGQYELGGKGFYTTYKGIRIPIDTFRYVEGTGKAPKGKSKPKVLTSKTSGYSLEPIRESSLIEPRSSLSKVGGSYPLSSYSLSNVSYLSGYSKPSKVGSSVISKISSRISSPLSSRPSSPISSGISAPPSSGITPKSYTLPGYSFDLISPPPKKGKKDRWREKKKKRDPFFIKQKLGYLPSFTALTFGITGKAEKIGKSYAPGIRPILDLPEVKTSKKKKKKLKVRI